MLLSPQPRLHNQRGSPGVTTRQGQGGERLWHLPPPKLCSPFPAATARLMGRGKPPLSTLDLPGTLHLLLDLGALTIQSEAPLPQGPERSRNRASP